jgi:hypothetical protein
MLTTRKKLAALPQVNLVYSRLLQRRLAVLARPFLVTNIDGPYPWSSGNWNRRASQRAAAVASLSDNLLLNPQ